MTCSFGSCPKGSPVVQSGNLRVVEKVGVCCWLAPIDAVAIQAAVFIGRNVVVRLDKSTEDLFVHYYSINQFPGDQVGQQTPATTIKKLTATMHAWAMT